MSAPARYQPSLQSVDRPSPASQATAIEQQRAIAEVQAAVVVAQNCPRDISRAEGEMQDTCGRMAMAEQAFYQVTNRGTGPSVHLMRELARIWGNVQFGVNELARSDIKGESEVQAWAWDVQTNTRSSRTFIVPHQRMRAGNRVDLTDLTDIYLNNQNIGARAVRECIATVLPRWYTETAQTVCRNTLEHGEGEPLQDRLNGLVKWFADKLEITQAQLEQRIGKKRGQWDAADGAQLKIAGGSITRGEATKDELFPPAESTTADEISRNEKKPPRKRATKKAAARTISDERRQLEKDMFKLLNDAGLGGDKERDNRLIVLAVLAETGDPIGSSTELTDAQIAMIIDTLESLETREARKAKADSILQEASAAEADDEGKLL